MAAKPGNGTDVGSIYGSLQIIDSQWNQALDKAEKRFRAFTKYLNDNSTFRLKLQADTSALQGRMGAITGTPRVPGVENTGLVMEKLYAEYRKQLQKMESANVAWTNRRRAIAEKAAADEARAVQREVASEEAHYRAYSEYVERLARQRARVAQQEAIREDKAYTAYYRHVQQEAERSARAQEAYMRRLMAANAGSRRGGGADNQYGSPGSRFATAFVGTLGGAIGRVGQAVAFGGGLAGLAAGAFLLGKNATNANLRMDSLRRGIEAVAGSSALAAKEISDLKEVAKLPGLGLEEAIQGQVNLQAAGMSAKLAKDSLMAFGNALATVGKGKAELEGVNIALTQIMSKGKVQGDEILQLMERVPQIGQIMKKAFGTGNTEELGKMGVSSTEFITKVVAELKKLPRVTGGVRNDFENLQDAVTVALDKIGTSIGPAVGSVVKWFTQLSQQFVDSGRMSDWLKETFAKFAETARSLGDVALSGLSNAYTILSTTFKAVVTAATPLLSAWNSLGTAGKNLVVQLGLLVVLWPKIVVLAQAVSGRWEALSTLAYVLQQRFIMMTVATRGMTMAQTANYIITQLMAGPAGWALLAAGVVAAGVAMKALNDALRVNYDAMQGEVRDTKAATAAIMQYSEANKAAAISELRLAQAKGKRMGDVKKAEVIDLQNQLDIVNDKLRPFGPKNGPALRAERDRLKAQLKQATSEMEHYWQEGWAAYNALDELSKAEKQAADTMSKDVMSALTGMRKEMFLLGDATAATAMQWEITEGQFAAATEAEKASLMDMAKQTDAFKASYESRKKAVEDSRDSMIESAKVTADGMKSAWSSYIERLKEVWDQQQAWFGKLADGMRETATAVVDILKDQLKREKDLRDKALDDAKSHYEKMGELGTAGAMAMTNIEMFKKQPDKPFSASDMNPENVRNAYAEYQANALDKLTQESIARSYLYPNVAIGQVDALANAKQPDFGGYLKGLEKLLDAKLEGFIRAIKDGSKAPPLTGIPNQW